MNLNLLPRPRHVRRHAGNYVLPARGLVFLPPDLKLDEVLLPIVGRISNTAEAAGSTLELVTRIPKSAGLVLKAVRSDTPPEHPEGYVLAIRKHGITVEYREVPGLRAAVATLRQLIREHGRKLPCLTIRDYPDFARRGVMLDVSRGRVPRLETLLELVDHLADFKINEFQLYVEHTFAYRNHEPVWRDWGALTAEEIMQLDARCRQLGIDFVPNQNSFGHLRHWLEHPPLRHLAEVDTPYPAPDNSFLRFPGTLAPNHPGTLPFLRELYDELLPCYTSRRFNVGCDETWDLGRGQSRNLCRTKGQGRVYLDFLLKIHREVRKRGRQMMFWGDIILHYPELVSQLPRDVIALNWGYDRNHPFDKECPLLADAGLPFYVCPGTSTWMTLIGKHDNGFANLKRAAKIGRAYGADGMLNTDWGDGGHPQPLAVSYPPYALGAAVAWNATRADEELLVPVLNRDVFCDPTGKAARAALALGMAHQRFGYHETNVTPFGAVIAAPPRKTRELFCRHGLKYFAVISGKNIRQALESVEEQRAILYRSRPGSVSGGVLTAEVDLAARMAAQSCKYMLWQQAVAAGRTSAPAMARQGIRELRDLDAHFTEYWPMRNKGTPNKCSSFLKWRMRDYRRGKLVFTPDEARLSLPKSEAPVIQ